MFRVAVAQSIELDSADAVAEVLDQCHQQLGDLQPQAGLLFAGIDFEFSSILDEISSVYPDVELIGCTTDGEMASVHGYTDDSLALMLLCTDELVFKSGVAVGVSEDTANTVERAVASVASELHEEPVLCIATPTSLTASGDNTVEGLQRGLGKGVPVFGGTAGDQWRFKGTYQFHRRTVYTDAAPFLLIAGPLIYSFGIDTGWIPIGPRKTVTKSENNVVYEIGGEKALHFYRHHLGEDIGLGDAGAISEYPLAVFEDDGELYYLRASTLLDRKAGSLTFVGNVPEGSTVQIAHSTRDRIVEAAERSIAASVKSYPGNRPLAALCFSCCARKQVLGTRVEEEYAAFQRTLPEIPIVGFYTYGEIGPLERGRPARFHNETFFNLVIGLT